MLPVEEDDGSPFAGLEAPVNAVRLCLNFSQKIVVTLDVSAAGGAYLDKSKLTQVVRIFLEETLNCPEPLLNTFCIVHPINANSEEKGVDAKLPQQRSFFSVDGLFAHPIALDFIKRHTDRERLHDGAMVFPLHREMIPVDARLYGAIHRLQKIVAIGVNMESN